MILFLKIHLSCYLPKVNQKPDFEMLLAFKWAILQRQYLSDLANYGFGAILSPKWALNSPILDGREAAHAEGVVKKFEK